MTKLVTQEQIGGWLNEVHADPGLTPEDFRTAFALSRLVDPDGFIGPAALAKIARTDKPEPTTAAIERLSQGGYLEASENRRKVAGFRIVARPSKARRAKSPKIVPFPADRRRAFIHKHAAIMARCSPVKADAHLRQQLRVQAETMRRKGISEDVVADEVRRLETAIKNELWTCVLLPERPA
jgi:hypothetical protein